MSNKTALPNSPTTENGTNNSDPTNAKNGVGEDAPDSRQDSFDARFTALTDGFGQACEQEGVELAVAIAIHPNEEHPIIFIRGHEYDAATIIASLLRNLTRRLLAPLNTNPNYEHDHEES